MKDFTEEDRRRVAALWDRAADDPALRSRISAKLRDFREGLFAAQSKDQRVLALPEMAMGAIVGAGVVTPLFFLGSIAKSCKQLQVAALLGGALGATWGMGAGITADNQNTRIRKQRELMTEIEHMEEFRRQQENERNSMTRPLYPTSRGGPDVLDDLNRAQ